MRDIGRVTQLIDLEISVLEAALEESNKHVIRSETLRKRVLLHIDISNEDKDIEAMTRTGFSQAVEQRLYRAGYRSVKVGYFVNLEKCENIVYLNELLRNADVRIEDKARIKDRIREIRDAIGKKADGQGRMILNGTDLVGIEFSPTKEEITAFLNGDSV